MAHLFGCAATEPAACEPPDALRREQHERDEDEAEEHRPRFRIGRELVLEQDEEGRPQEGQARPHRDGVAPVEREPVAARPEEGGLDVSGGPAPEPFDIFKSMQRTEWDTLMFFYGIMLCVGGLGALGYLAVLSSLLYQGLGATAANILVGILSAVIDNIPIMFAVLSMNPDMNLGQWLLVTMTAGVGGSLLSIGSAAGVALMGQTRGVYTFLVHLKWTWAIALGYAASIGVHWVMNGHLFNP